MCWRVNIAIWMDPLNKENQTNSETITNTLYKAPHGHSVLYTASGGSVNRQGLSMHHAWCFTTEVNHCDLCGLVFHGKS